LPVSLQVCENSGPALVAGGGDMLAVLKRRRAMDVFKIDAAGNMMERVKSIGSQALFLGVRCLVVDTACFPTVEATHCRPLFARPALHLQSSTLELVTMKKNQRSFRQLWAALRFICPATCALSL